MSNFTIHDMLTMQQALQENIKTSGSRSARKLVSINCYGCSVKQEKLLTSSRKTETKRLLKILIYGSILLKKWQMCSCITMMSFYVMESVSKN